MKLINGDLLIHVSDGQVRTAFITQDTEYLIEKYTLADGQELFRKVEFEEVGTADQVRELRRKVADLEKLVAAYREIQHGKS